jgi:hypothetical protein
MSSSVIPATLDRLDALFRASAAADVQVIYGSRQVVGVTKDKVVLVGEVEFINDVADFGDTQDESFTISCVAEVTISGAKDEAGQRQAVAAVMAVYGDAIASIRALAPDESLGVAGLQYARPTGRGRVIHSTSLDVLKRGRGASVPFTITCLGVL